MPPNAACSEASWTFHLKLRACAACTFQAEGGKEGETEGEEEEAERPFRRPFRKPRPSHCDAIAEGAGRSALPLAALSGRRVRGFESRLEASEAGLGKR